MKFLAFLLLPFTLSAASVDGLNIHYSSAGAGPRTVVLVHGYTCDETSWSEQAPLAKPYRVVTLDLPGHGKSDSPKVEQFSMDLFARAIEAVRSEVGANRIVLAGHSMGTPVVLRYARMYPQHAAALVFVDGLMPAPNSNETSAKQQGLAMGGPDGRKNREAMIGTFFNTASTPAIQAKVRNMMLSAPETTAVGAMIATRDPAGQTLEIPKLPILAIYASPSQRASKQMVQARFPDAEYVEIPGTGHFLMMEKPAEFNALLLAFLSKQAF
jgi:pimeloyl-ACP methyl ester carboxylesterase